MSAREPSPPPAGHIYTFYSYKGGVGRSMAMASIAEYFYLQGLRVVMIDWDLEAPGLETFFYRTPLSTDGAPPPPTTMAERVRSRLGLIDLLTHYRDTYASFTDYSPTEFRNALRSQFPLDRYLHVVHD
jgi:hypothetical protein